MRRNTSSWDNFQERAFLENQLDRRIQFFLIFIVVSIAVTLLIPTKEIAMMFLILSVIASWLLVVSIIATNSKLKNVEKEIGKSTGLKDKIVKILYAIALPILSAVLITTFLLLVVSGSIDSILPYKTKVATVVNEGVKKATETLDKSLKTKKENPSKYFKSVDSIITENKNNYVVIDTNVAKGIQQKTVEKKTIVKKPKSNPNFKSIEKIIND
ncbi:MAG: hypothetical protein HZA74_07445 [Ignavibacteriales bacterium]|nr:hypothetical protein [Ignavibacteriales bacterium]